MQSLPIGMPRMAEISFVIFAAGRTPPRPGFAPWVSLISIARTGFSATRSKSRSRSSFPFSSRHPK